MLYVDRPRRTKPTADWPYDMACHLYSDAGKEELLDFATRVLNLKPEWIHHHRNRSARIPHFDLTLTKRIRAVALGAAPLADKHQWGAFVKCMLVAYASDRELARMQEKALDMNAMSFAEQCEAEIKRRVKRGPRKSS